MKSIVTRKYLIPFALVASLFFCWGFAHSILDVLNKHFQNMLEISKTRSALVQAYGIWRVFHNGNSSRCYHSKMGL